MFYYKLTLDALDPKSHSSIDHLITLVHALIRPSHKSQTLLQITPLLDSGSHLYTIILYVQFSPSPALLCPIFSQQFHLSPIDKPDRNWAQFENEHIIYFLLKFYPRAQLKTVFHLTEI